MGTFSRTPLAIGALALLLCALVAATSDPLRWERAGTGPVERTTEERTEPDQAGSRTAEEREEDASEGGEEDSGAAWVPPLDLTLVLLTAAVLALAVATALRLRLLWRRRLDGSVDTRAGAVPYPDDPDDAPEPELVEAVQGGLADLREGDPRNAIVAAWLRLEAATESEHFTRDPADTPTEFVRRVLAAYRLDAAAIDRLAARYREARFSEHVVTEAHRAEARRCLEALLTDLRAVRR